MFRSSIIQIVLSTGVALLSTSQVSALDQATAADQAGRLYMRLTGMPANLSTLTQITELMMNGEADKVAFIAMNDINFYKSTLKMMFAPFSNRGGVNSTFTDYEATIVGMIKDNNRFDEVLYGDFVYTADDATSTYTVGAATAGPLIRILDNNDAPPTGKVRPLYRNQTVDTVARVRYEDNTHYDDLANISDWPNKLQRRNQVSVYGISTESNTHIVAEDVAGVVTTRQSAAEYFSAGTNRRPIKYLMETFMCGSLEEFRDSSVPDPRVRKDVVRSPGGNSENYTGGCRGCHAGVDGMSGGLLYIDYANDQLRYNRTALQNSGYVKLRSFNNFPEGHQPIDNSWENFWATYGTNATRFGWQTPVGGGSITQGVGANSLFRAFAATRKFSSCMASRVFKQICFRDPTPNENNELGQMAANFEAGMAGYATYNASNPYNMRALFASVSNMCFGHE